MELSSTVYPRIDMASLGQILSKTFFWSYERGTWQYDVAVILILIFVLVTPRGWFHDKPESGILAPPTKLALQNDLHTALQEALPELHNGNFSIAKIEPVHDDQGGVIAYQVEIRH